jgi:hypothetical protein
MMQQPQRTLLPYEKSFLEVLIHEYGFPTIFQLLMKLRPLRLDAHKVCPSCFGENILAGTPTPGSIPDEIEREMYCPSCQSEWTTLYRLVGFSFDRELEGGVVTKPERIIQGRTYTQWMTEVDSLCLGKYGVRVRDGADFLSYDIWESGGNPEEGLEAWEEANDII